MDRSSSSHQMPLEEPVLETTESPNLCHAFIFVNPGSGGGKAALFLKETEVVYHYSKDEDLSQDVTVKLHIFDMTKGESGNRESYKALKSYTAEGHRVISAACGGDGSVMWMMNEMRAHEINLNNVLSTVIPYGTGNDFARSLGWNDFNDMKPYKLRKGKTVLYALVKQWLCAERVGGDLWRMDLKLRDGGRVVKIGGGRKKVDVAQRSFDLMNYFSIGPDARIGIGFDRNRSKGPKRNKVVYFLEGAKKFFARRPLLPLSDWIECLEDGDGKKIIDHDDAQKMIPRTLGIVATNVPSYMAGENIWKTAFRSGFTRPKDRPDIEELLKAKQKMGDGKLEWLSAKHKISYPCEKISLGLGHFRRLHQGEGPFVLRCNEVDEGQQTDEHVRCYFNVDGEYFQATKPESFTITLQDTINILACRPRSRDDDEVRVKRGSVIEWMLP